MTAFEWDSIDENKNAQEPRTEYQRPAVVCNGEIVMVLAVLAPLAV
jgi:hypothetical protein